MNGRKLLEGCGIGIALTLSYIWGPLSLSHIGEIYLRALPVSSVAGGAALDLIAASLLCRGALVLLDRFDRPGETLIWVLVTAVVPAVAVQSALRLAEVNFPIPNTAAIASVLVIPAIIIWRFWPKGYAKLVTGFRLGYMCAGICILWVLPELALAAMHHAPRDTMETTLAANAAPQSAGTRIVWLLLDELSYDQTFDHRQAGLQLGNFDALRAVSTSFSDVRPAGYMTDQIVPALLSGRPVADIGSSTDGALRVRESNGGSWERFEPEATLFGDAQRLGWNTGIVGWFNPYCRLFGAVVNSCTWEPESRVFPGHMSSSKTAWENALAPVAAKFRQNGDMRKGAEHGRSYAVLMAKALELVRNSQERFVFVHLPVPHPPGIYDRTNGRMSVGGSYLDNLVLADKSLGMVRAAIEASPAADSTILIVSGDHSMRVPMWRGGTNWSAEDERVFGKHFDTRPVLMVHFAGEQSGSTMSAPFAELRTHAMIEEMFQGKMSSEADLEAWVGAGASQPIQ